MERAVLAGSGDRLSFRPRAALTGRDARELAREVLLMSQPEFSAAFKGSPMKRAKLRGLQRNSAVVLGDVGTSDDVLPALTAALGSDEPLVRGHAAWALGRVGSPAAAVALRDREVVESDAWVRSETGSALFARARMPFQRDNALIGLTPGDCRTGAHRLPRVR